MWSLALFLSLTLLLYFWLKRILSLAFLRAENSYAGKEAGYNELLKANTRLQEENFALERIVQEKIALYDITRDLCRSLDEEKVFAIFKGHLNKYIGIKECRFIKEASGNAKPQAGNIFPIKIEKTLIGQLVIEEAGGGDKEKLNILLEQFALGMKRAILYQRVQAIAISDGLTGVFSRRYCLERFGEELQRSKKFKHNTSFMMVDVDYFKGYNDRYGHLVGDAILSQIAATIKENIRQIDLVGRYGGEEFSVVLVESGAEQSKFVGERIRKAVEEKRIRVYDEDLKVTVSIGISTFPEDSAKESDIIDCADKALYRAKESGRNRVCLYLQKEH